MLGGKDLGESGMNHLYPPKNRSSSEESHALCLMELERNLVLLASIKQPDDKFDKALLAIWRIKDSNWTKTSRQPANRKGVVFHPDNAQPHVSLTTWQKLLELVWDVLLHLPYLPDIAPSDFHLLSHYKISLMIRALTLWST